MATALTPRERRWLAALVAVIVGARLATLGAYPLMDSTESRYAEIARKMLETGDWLVPQFDYGVPFWGKPPLSTWLSAMAMAVFGVNEFAARLPSLLLLVGCGALVRTTAVLRGGRDQGLWTLALFASTGLVFVAAGGVMTDPALVLGTTLMMTGFWFAVTGPERSRALAGWAFFAGLAIGLLAKGPVALVLAGVPVGAATLFTRSWGAAWRRMPWVAGTLATAVVTIAWYGAAERASPGFLDYFLIGEHWNRFVHPGWKGDLYGAAHARPRGTIWLFWIAAGLPWSIAALAWLARGLRRPRERVRDFTDPWRIYLLLWALTPMVFFTPAGNILVTYVLPGLPAFALLLGDLWRPQPDAADARSGDGGLRTPTRQVLAAGIALPAVFIAGIVALHGNMERERSHKALVRDYTAARADPQSRLVYVPQRPQSADFYSAGKALRVADVAALRPYLDDATADFFAIRDQDLAMLPEADRARLHPVGRYGEWQLLRETPPR